MSNNLGDALRKAGFEVPKPQPKEKEKNAGGARSEDSQAAPEGRPQRGRPADGRQNRAGGPQRQELAIPPECVFPTYYGEGGTLRREVFVEAAEKVARLFNNRDSNVRPFALRLYLNRVKAIERDLRNKACTFDQVRERLYAMKRDAAYQVGRRTLGPVFSDFLGKNLDLATKDEKEFRGFVEYLTSVVAYCRQRE